MIRHHYFQRPNDPPTISIQSRDLEILSLLYHHRLMSEDQLATFFSSQLQPIPPHIHRLAGKTNTGEAIRKRLRLLFQTGYLERLAHPYTITANGAAQPYIGIIYTLNGQGLQLLAAATKEPLEPWRWITKKSQPAAPYLRHALAISDFFISLSLALSSQPSRKLIHWDQSQAIHQRFKDAPNSTIRPDAFFVLTDANHTPKGFFLEIDQATIREAKMLERYKRYWSFWQTQGHLRLKVDNFRVLTVTPSPARALHLRLMAKQADPKHTGSSMFLFAHQSWSSAQPQAILNPVWQSPKDDRCYSLTAL